MASNKIKKRLGKEIQVLVADLPPGVRDVHIDEKNMHTIHFLCMGPPDTPFQGGQYVVKLMLPPGYPMDPPDFMMLTPNGRFSPEEKSNAQGVIFTSKEQKEAFAAQSVAWNIRHNYDKLLPRLRQPLADDASSKASAPVASQTAPPPAPCVDRSNATPQSKAIHPAKAAAPAQVVSSTKRALPDRPLEPAVRRQRTAAGGAAVRKQSANELVDLALDADIEGPTASAHAARREVNRRAAPAAAVGSFVDVVDLT